MICRFTSSRRLGPLLLLGGLSRRLGPLLLLGRPARRFDPLLLLGRLTRRFGSPVVLQGHGNGGPDRVIALALETPLQE